MPTTYASDRQYVGLALEVTAGTPVPPTTTVPFGKFDPFDKWNFIEDTSMRGSMTGPYNIVQGVGHTEFDFDGPIYFDTFGFFLANIFGDYTYSGTYTGSGTTTLAAGSAINAVTISTVASIPALTLIQIGTGVSAEVRTTSAVSGGGPYTVTVPALSRAHSTSDVVKPITTPYSQFYSLLNTGSAQPGTLTFTDYQGPTSSAGMRSYAGACCSELTIKGTVESATMMYDAKFLGWPSATAATFTSSPSTSLPQAAWRTQAGINGTVGGAPVLTVNEYTVGIKRELKPYWTAQNTQNPYIIQRGTLNVDGNFNFVISDETALTYMNSNTQPQVQLIISNGLSGANLLSMQLDMQAAAYLESKISRGNPAVEYATSWKAIANTTNAGFSGGFSPLAVTMQNAIAALTFGL